MSGLPDCHPAEDLPARERSAGFRNALFALSLGLILLFSAVAGQWRDLQPHARAFQIVYTIGFAGYVGFLALIWRNPSRWSHRHYYAVMIVAVVARILIFTGPTSDDVARYVWEGRIQWHGFNPYTVAPDDPQLIPLRDAHWSDINHPELPAIYPPLSQLLFALVTKLSPTIYAMKLVMIALDLFTLAMLANWLRAEDRPMILAGVYGLCPLVLAAVAMEGHHDALMLLCMVMAGWCARRGWWHMCALCIALAVLSKLMAAVLLFWLAFRRSRALPTALLIILAGYLPYVGAGKGLIRSLWAFGGGDFFNTPFAEWVIPFLPNHTVRLLFAAIGLFYVIWIGHQRLPMHHFALRAFAAMLLLIPVVHYWYVTWVVVFLALCPLKGPENHPDTFFMRWSWVVLTGTMVFYFNAWHYAQQFGEWRLTNASRLLIWLPLLAVLAVEQVRAWRRAEKTQDESV